MEKYNIKITITNVNGELIDEATFDTANIAEVKAFGQTNIVENFIENTLENIRETRRSNPHHHQNRLD